MSNRRAAKLVGQIQPSEWAERTARDLCSPESKKTAHEHQFTVPVEWEYEHKPVTYVEAPMGKTSLVVVAKRVTKLRCSGCPEEIER